MWSLRPEPRRRTAQHSAVRDAQPGTRGSFSRWTTPLPQLLYEFSLGPLQPSCFSVQRSACWPWAKRLLLIEDEDQAIDRLAVLTLAAVVVILDQCTKVWMTGLLRGGQTRTAVPGLLDLQLVRNTGAAFSLFETPLASGSAEPHRQRGRDHLALEQRRLPAWQALAVAFLLGEASGMDWTVGASAM